MMLRTDLICGQCATAMALVERWVFALVLIIITSVIALVVAC